MRLALDWTYRACGAAAAVAVLIGIAQAVVTKRRAIARFFRWLVSVSYQIALWVLTMLIG